ncbi:hypothetical protein Kirov_227 [Bacillus phage Kirov]|uniref:Uncharacterized protein n=1 Tax=Bacillus phage Kirov TaxID=2783539 RepID=A0A7U3NKM5_9CAUD|nr:hypothetical protein PQE67_gp077 [Bacillus phage Kirov]QOV08426.1 hypothetical protein Kirov_227 [Bacillus phage Kirov]
MEFEIFETRVSFPTDDGYKEGLVVDILAGGQILYVRDDDYEVWEVSKWHVRAV